MLAHGAKARYERDCGAGLGVGIAVALLFLTRNEALLF